MCAVYEAGIEMPSATREFMRMEEGAEMHERTFQESHCPIQAFWAQFIVAERPKELADEDVHLFRYDDGAHIAEQQLDFIAPFTL